MKYLSFFAILLLCLNSCKKDEKVVEINSQKDSVNVINKSQDSVLADNLQVEPLNITAEKGKTVFSQDKKTILYFNTQSNLGEIKIEGKTYTLDLMNFTDNEYHISGDGVKISATEGDFKEMTGDCLYGYFPEVKVELNNQEIILKNISVQDCPAY